ncbi:MAG: hypothetical protein GXO78_13670 [Calditrichaeota bacterium]|nr:hypothetical protein [Calditrichota bacterium]
MIIRALRGLMHNVGEDVREAVTVFWQHLERFRVRTAPQVRDGRSD